MQWRLIASHLITRLSRDSLSDKTEVGAMPNTSGIHVLSELFVVLGYFALNNRYNQVRPGSTCEQIYLMELFSEMKTPERIYFE